MPYCFNDNKSKANFNVKSYTQPNQTISAHGSGEVIINVPVSDGLPIAITTAYGQPPNSTTKTAIMLSGFEIIRYNTPQFHQVRLYVVNQTSLSITFNYNLSLCMVG